MFTDITRGHDCPNITFDECDIVLIDKDFDIQTCTDEYELSFEINYEKDENIIESVNDSHLTINNLFKTKEFFDEVNKAKIQSMRRRNSELLVIKDNFDYPLIEVNLQLHFDSSCTDLVKIQKFVNDLILVYSNAILETGTSFSALAQELSFAIKMCGIDPLFMLDTLLINLSSVLLATKLHAVNTNLQKNSFFRRWAHNSQIVH